MKTWKSLAIASILTGSLIGLVAACGSSSDDGGTGGKGTGGSSGAGTGGGTGGSAADGGLIGDGSSGSGGAFLDGSPGETSADAFDPDAACATTTVSATLTPANLLFLIDRTGSMNCNPPPTQSTAQCDVSPVAIDNSPTKWEITHDALVAAWNGLQNADPLPSIGVMLFNNNDACGFPTVPSVEVQPLSGPQLNQLVLNLDAVQPKGSTPIIGATLSAYQYVNVNAANFTGNKFVVLLTDGAETCDMDPNSKGYLIEKAEQATWIGIRTFVLGAPGSESERAFLSQIAFAGGTASSPTCDHSGSAPDMGDCHMDMTLPGMNFAQELQENLEAISGEALSCEFEVPQPGPGEPAIDYNKVNVVYTDGNGTETTILQDNTVDCSDGSNQGWQYSDDKSKIYLCGAACETVKGDNQASISIQLGCVTQVVPK